MCPFLENHCTWLPFDRRVHILITIITKFKLVFKLFHSFKLVFKYSPLFLREKKISTQSEADPRFTPSMGEFFWLKFSEILNTLYTVCLGFFRIVVV